MGEKCFTKDMVTLLNIHGPVAAGKSTAVKHLLNELEGYVFIDRASIKHNLKALGREEAKRVARAGVYHLLEECIRLDADILTQELQPDNIRKRLGGLLDEHGYRFLSFRLEAPWEVTLQRNEQRGKNATEERMREIWNAYDRDSTLDIVVDTEKHGPDETVDIILKELG